MLAYMQLYYYGHKSGAESGTSIESLWTAVTRFFMAFAARGTSRPPEYLSAAQLSLDPTNGVLFRLTTCKERAGVHILLHLSFTTNR